MTALQYEHIANERSASSISCLDLLLLPTTVPADYAGGFTFEELLTDAIH